MNANELKSLSALLLFIVNCIAAGLLTSKAISEKNKIARGLYFASAYFWLCNAIILIEIAFGR